MKNLFLIGLAVILFTACQESKPDRYFTSSPEIDSLKELISDYHEGDWESWVGHYADTAKIFHNDVKNGVSPKETVESLKEILANVSSYKFDESDSSIFHEMIITDNGDKWVHFWGNWQGTMAANGEQLGIPVHLAMNFVDGKIVSEYGFYNLSEFTALLDQIAAFVNEKESE